jgi:hypothetical protein
MGHPNMIQPNIDEDEIEDAVAIDLEEPLP